MIIINCNNPLKKKDSIHTRIEIPTQSRFLLDRCILSPLLFIIAIYYVMRKAMNSTDFGLIWKAKRRLTNLDLADDLLAQPLG